MKNRVQVGKCFFNILQKDDYHYLKDLILYFWTNFSDGPLDISNIVEIPATTWDRKHYLFSLCDGQFLYVEVGFDIDFKTNKVETLAICYKLYHRLFELSLHPVKYIAFSFVYQEQYDLDLVNNYGMYNQQTALEIKRMEKKHYDCHRIEKYKREKNLLGQNQFYIINMSMLDSVFKDYSVNEKFLNWILQIHKEIQEFNQYLEKNCKY